ncbi:hypothetical protein Palpr_1664 [Paludibacter propionicigenes WB4]|uniref:Uncharacterized protein n=2 Tax=Paludibacter TaxID=346096 RepID=E4T511_PALPW|nr:hypothetical protein Palpr_1664 [Paludibacter propionicigenes WB4]
MCYSFCYICSPKANESIILQKILNLYLLIFYMKNTFFFLIVVSLLLLSSCATNTDFLTSPLTFKGVSITSLSNAETEVFTSYDIKSFNGTTGQICFVDEKVGSKLSHYRKLNCYIGTDSIFSVNLTSDVMSSVVNDLVLNSSSSGNYYFADGYPALIQNAGSITLRAQNKTKRANSWALFIAILKTEQKYND